MWQQSLGRSPLVIAGALGLCAGVLVAHQMSSSYAADQPPAASASQSNAGGLVFLDSKPGVTSVNAATPAAPAAPSAHESGGFARIAMMALVLVGGGVAWFVMRRRQQGKGGTSAPSLSLVGTVRIAGRWQVALVKVPGKTLVLGATDKGLSLLSELDDDVEHERLEERVRDADDTLSFATPRSPESRLTTDRERGPETRRSEPFSRLLEELAKGGNTPHGPPAREGSPTGVRTDRPRTDEALALRARLERHQPAN